MESTSALGAIKRRFWVVVVLTLAGITAGALPEPGSIEDQATFYRATHTLLVNDPQAIGGGTAVVASQVGLLASVGEVPIRAAEELGYEGSPGLLADQVDVSLDEASGALYFWTTQADPESAVLIADTFAEVTNAYLVERQDVVYEERLSATLERLSNLEEQLNELTERFAREGGAPLAAQQAAVARRYGVAFEQYQGLIEAPPVLTFTTLQSAEAIEVVDRGLRAPASREVRGAMGGIVGAALGVGLAVLLGRLDRRIRTREQAEAIVGMRARAIIPKSRDQRRDRLVVVTGRHDPLSDSYRTVRNVVGFVHGTLDPVERARVTLVVSPGPGDGKTSLAVNLAAALVETGQRTIAVNTDFRRPRLDMAIGSRADPHPFVLDDLEVLEARSLLTRTEVPGLLVFDLSTIDGTAGELVRATANVMPSLAEMCDSIVVDTSPVGATAEVLDMVPFADVIVVSVRLGHTSIVSARRTIGILRDISDSPIVLVVNSVKQERAPYYEYTSRVRSSTDEAPGWRTRLRTGRKNVDDAQRVG